MQTIGCTCSTDIKREKKNIKDQKRERKGHKIIKKTSTNLKSFASLSMLNCMFAWYSKGTQINILNSYTDTYIYAAQKESMNLFPISFQ